MRLKEEVIRSLDNLDNISLTLVYEQRHLLQKAESPIDERTSALPIEEVLEMTNTSHGSWGDDIIAERGDFA